MPAADFSPELRLLLAMSRAAIASGPRPPAPPSGFDWGAFARLVDRHRLAPLLYLRAVEAVTALCPAHIVQRIQALARANNRRALACAAEQISLVQTLTAHGIDVLVLKGLVLSQQLYGNIHTRSVGDIDLLIRPSDAERAHALMQAGGWRRTIPHFPLTRLQTTKYLELKPEFEYQRGDPPQRTELRWRMEGATDPELVFARAVSCPLGGQPMRTLPADLNVVYLLQHGARHGWFRLFWLVDIAVLTRAPSFAAATTMEIARQLHAEHAVWQGMALVEEFFGLECPAPLRPPHRQSTRVARLAAGARWIVVADQRQLDSLPGWLRQLMNRMRLQGGLRAKLAIMRPHLFSPLNWHMWPLPDRWFFLYYLATPFLWLWRRARRSG